MYKIYCMRNFIGFIGFICFVYIIAGTVWPLCFPDHQLIGKEHNIIRYFQSHNELDGNRNSDESTSTESSTNIESDNPSSSDSLAGRYNSSGTPDETSTESDNFDGGKDENEVEKKKERTKWITCPNCNGRGREDVTCERCQGRGKRDSRENSCFKCDGIGTREIECRVRECNGGRVPEFR